MTSELLGVWKGMVVRDLLEMPSLHLHVGSKFHPFHTKLAWVCKMLSVDLVTKKRVSTT